MQAHRLKRWELAQDAPDVPLEEHLRMELRISWTMVRAAEIEMHDLGLGDDAFIYEQKESESRDGGPGGGYVSAKRAKLMGAHPLIITYLKEREHHMAVVRACIAAGLAARQIQAVERFAENILASMTMLAEKLGHDPHDPHVRAMTLEVLRRAEDALSDPTRGPQAIEG